MSQNYGIESPRAHRPAPHRAPTRYLVVIEAAGAMVARLCSDARAPVAEFDAGTEEVAQMTQGLAPAVGALGPEWDLALEGHNAAERGAAAVYTLDI